MSLMTRRLPSSATGELSDDEPLPPGVLAADDDAPPGVSASPPQTADENSQYSLSDSLSEPDSDGPPGAWDDDLPPGVEIAFPPPPPPPPPPKTYVPDAEMIEKLTYARVKEEFIEIMKCRHMPKEAYDALVASPSPNLLFRELIKKGLMPMPAHEVMADLPPLEMFDDLEGSIYRDGISSLVRHLLPYCEEDISYLTKVPSNAVPLSEIASQVFGVKKEVPRYQIRIPSPEYQPPPVEERVPTPPPPPEPIPESRSRVKKLLEQKRLELARRKAQLKMTPSQLVNLKNSLKKQEKEELRLPNDCETKLDESSQESENGLSVRSQEDSEVPSPDTVERKSRLIPLFKRSGTPPQRSGRSSPLIEVKDRSSSSESSSEPKVGQKRPRDKIATDKPIIESKENGSLGPFSMKIQPNKGGMKDTLRKLSFGTEEEEEIERREREKTEAEEKKRKAAEEEAERAQLKKEKREAREKSKECKKQKRERDDSNTVPTSKEQPSISTTNTPEVDEVQVKVKPLTSESAAPSSVIPQIGAVLAQALQNTTVVEDPDAEEERRLLEQMLKAQAELEKLKQRRLQQLQNKPVNSEESVSSTQEKSAGDIESDAQRSQEDNTVAPKNEEEDDRKAQKKAKKKAKKLKKKQKKQESEPSRQKTEKSEKSEKTEKSERAEKSEKAEKSSTEVPPPVAKSSELDMSAFRDDELEHVTDRTFKKHLRFPICGIRYTLAEPSLKFSANLRHLTDLTHIVDRERPVESYVSQRTLENEVEPMDMGVEMEISPIKTHNLIQINTIDDPLPYSNEEFNNTSEELSVNYQGNLLEVPIVCAAESTSSGNSPPVIASCTSNAPQEQDSPESTTGPPKPCLSKSRRSNQPKSVSFFDGTVPEKDPLALSPPPPSQVLAERRKNRQRVSLLPPAAMVNANALTRQNLPPPPPPPGEAPILYALDPINKHVYEVLHPGNGIAITPGGVRSLDAQKYIYGEVVHTNETVLVENFLHLVYKFPYLINGEPE